MDAIRRSGIAGITATVLAGGLLLVAPAVALAQETEAQPGTFSQEPLAEPAGDPASDPAGETSFFLWTDNSVSLLPYGTGFDVDPEEQSTFTFEHAHESRIGDMFFFADWNKFHGSPGGDAWYAEIGPRFSFGKMFDKDLSHTFFEKSMFEIKDVLLAMQYERGEDPDVAEAFLIGLGLNLDVRKAGILGGLGKFNYVQMNFYARRELTEGTRSGFNDMQVTMVASYPFEVGDSQWLLDGFFDWVVGFGSEDWSYHLNPQLTMDVGSHWGKPGKFYMGIEVDLWWNKFQIPDSAAFDTDQQAVSLLLKYHL